MIHKVLTWFNQPCLRTWMIENYSTIQQRILQRSEPNTTIGLSQHPIFFHSLYPYHITSLFTPSGTSYSSLYLYLPHIVFIDSSTSHDFFSSWLRIFIDIFSITFLYFIIKSNFTVKLFHTIQTCTRPHLGNKEPRTKQSKPHTIKYLRLVGPEGHQFEAP